ncbi:MAG: aminomethyl-transferring glycine dehydrogenase subunit GcvPA [Armatimonadetes bacterium]|nr:aminomethyl-transferring glycine dehydrogenase subunit GcvPA [Armatimonadota bacterium]
MNYVPHTPADREKMLDRIGVRSVDELFHSIGKGARLDRALQLPEALTEHELLAHLEELAARNHVPRGAAFLGAGAYRHYIPSAVDMVISRSEFLTAYTPYQPEVSQGTLQTIFEFQSLMCLLTGMDVTNASVYDGGCAAVDGVFMALGSAPGTRVLVSEGVHPHTRELLRTYLASREGCLVEVPLRDGRTHLEEIGPDVACVVFQVPNFLGQIEDGPALCQAAARARALSVVVVGDPVSLAVLSPPAEYGADIVVGDAQPVGLPPSFGGPYAGYVSCRKKLLRRIPGRLCGMTVDSRGNRAYCLTLQAREQHIRREKAASNICTNQGLCALAVTAHLALLGPQGLREAAHSCVTLAEYFKTRVAELEGYELPLKGPSFHEVVLRCPGDPTEIRRQLVNQHGMEGGYPLGHDYPELKDCMLLCFTETSGRADVDRLVGALRSIGARTLEVAGR